MLRNSSEREALVGESDVSLGLQGVDVLKGTEFRGSIGDILRLLWTSSLEPVPALFLAIGEKYAVNPVGVVFNSFDFILFGVEYNSSMGRVSVGCDNFESSRGAGANVFIGTGRRRVWRVQYMSFPLWNGLAAVTLLTVFPMP